MERMSFVLILSLKEMALRRVAVNVWSETDILSMVQKLQFLNYFPVRGQVLLLLGKYQLDVLRKSIHDQDLLKSIQVKVEDKVSKLKLPESLKKRIMFVVRPIGLEIIKWKTFHEEILYYLREYIDINILRQLNWTCTGAVDYRKTAEELIRVRAFDVVKLYKVACLYCLVDAIPVLWDELPNDYKENLNLQFNFFELEPQGLQIYWANVLREKQSGIHCISAIPCRAVMLDYSARMGYKEATMYFFERLTKREHNDLLMKTSFSVIESCALNLSPRKSFSDTLCYLLTQMSPEQKIEAIKSKPSEFLAYFLNWPMQDFFLDIADLIWTVLSEIEYGKLLQLLLKNILISRNQFPNLFQEFFVRSPHSFKQRLVQEACRDSILFFILSYFEDAETIKTIFRNIDYKDKVELVFSNTFIIVLDVEIQSEDWTLVELFFREAALSREDMDRFKETFLEFIINFDRYNYIETDARHQQWNRFLDFLDNTYTTTVNKRSAENEMQTKSKMLCCQEEKDVLPSK